MRLLLIRHGQTPANVLGQLDTGHPGAELSELGVRQALEVPSALRDDVIHGIFSSPLLRARQTAEPLADDRGMPVQVLDGLKEIGAGDVEMRSDRTAVRSYLETVFAWADGELSLRMPGGENGHEFFERFDAAVEAMLDEGRTSVAAFSHGAAMRVWSGLRAWNGNGTFAAHNQLANTGVAELNREPDGRWTLSAWMGAPVGGAALDDPDAEDPTGDTLR